METLIPLFVAGSLCIISKHKQQSNKEGFLTKQPERVCPPPVKSTPNTLLKEEPRAYRPSGRSVVDMFHPDYIKSKLGNETITLGSGETIPKSEFTHANTQPSFGSTVKTGIRNDNREGILDNATGAGTYHSNKTEQAPLFKPQAEMGWQNGMPSTTDLFQSRVNTSLKYNNMKPFQEERVGPNMVSGTDLSKGLGGFNAGLIGRDQWMPKTVDELRVKNNKKESFEGVTLGGKYSVTNRGIMGEMNKQRPDTYFINTPERYFTTTGNEKAPTTRSRSMMKPENRAFTTQEHFGVPKHYKSESYLAPRVDAPKRPELDADSKHTSNMYAPNVNNSVNSDRIDNYRKSQGTNFRTDNPEPDQTGYMGTTMKAMISPVMDLLRPSRKDNVVGNIRPTGNAGVTVPAGTVFNPADRTRTTIREFTEHDSGHRFVGNQVEGAYYTSKQTPVTQQRDKTNVSYVGNHTNTTSNVRLYNAAYNAKLIDKSTVSQGRTPTQSGTKASPYPEQMNVSSRVKSKPDTAIYMNNTGYTSSMPPSYGQGGETRFNVNKLEKEVNRNSPELLNAFRSNPYSQSLNTY
jgi:hypothetical protein